MPGTEPIKFCEPFAYGEAVLNLASKGGNIYILSDLHLAAGVNANDNYQGTENFMADYAFTRLLKFLSDPSGIKKHMLVINGDVIDFLRITDVPASSAEFDFWQNGLAAIGIVKSTEMLQSSIIEREKKYGLETHDFKSVWKLMIAARGHWPLISGLAEWVRQGNQLVITKGNHDLEWYWKAVRDALKMELCKMIHGVTGTNMQTIATDIIDPLVSFADQALLIDQEVYCEHGHRFERFTTIDGPPVLENGEELNLPFGSFFNRYLVNRVELAYPYIDNIRPRQQILSILLRERFPLAIKLLFSYVPFTLKIIPKNQYRFALYYLLQFLGIIALPLIITAYAIVKTYHPPAAASGGILITVLSGLKNLVFLSSSYFFGRLFSWLQLSGPSGLSGF